MNEHENQTMKIFGKRLTASLLGAALVMSMPFASALTQKNITESVVLRFMWMTRSSIRVTQMAIR